MSTASFDVHQALITLVSKVFFWWFCMMLGFGECI